MVTRIPAVALGQAKAAIKAKDYPRRSREVVQLEYPLLRLALLLSLAPLAARLLVRGRGKRSLVLPRCPRTEANGAGTTLAVVMLRLQIIPLMCPCLASKAREGTPQQGLILSLRVAALAAVPLGSSLHPHSPVHCPPRYQCQCRGPVGWLSSSL